MTKYEHKLVLSDDLIRLQQDGESLGDQGWRVVASWPASHRGLSTLVLEREVR